MTWVKGVSGNPKGKTPGTESKIAKLRKQIADRIPEVIDRLLYAAIKEGDTQAAKLLLERSLAPLRAESMPLSLNLPEKATLVDIGKSVIEAISSGSISTDQGAQILSVLTGQAKLKESEEIEKWLAALEQATNTNPNHN